MKILHVCLANFFIDNHSYQENMLTKYHKLNGLEVEVIASLVSFDENGEFTELNLQENVYYNKDNIKVTRLDYRCNNPLIKKARIYKNLDSELKKSNPDIIFIHGCQFIDIVKIKKYIEFKKKNGKKVTVFVDNHADFSNSATNWISKQILHKIFWRYCAKIIEPYTTKFYGVLPARVDFLKNIYKTPLEKTELLVMGADDQKINVKEKDIIRSKIRKKFNICDDDILIISGGKIDRAKIQTLNLLEATKMLNKKIKVILFGSIIEELKEPILKYVDNEKIFYLGWINSEEAYDYFLAADLGIFPGRHSVLWEQAVGTGLPCVFKYWEGTDHVDVGGNCKFLYKDSTEEIINTLNNLLEGNELENMKKNAVKSGIGAFSYNEISIKSLNYLVNIKEV